MSNAIHDSGPHDRALAGENATLGQIVALIVVGTALALTCAGLAQVAGTSGTVAVGPAEPRVALQLPNEAHSFADCPAEVNIPFARGSSRIAPDARELGKEFVEWARLHPQVDIEVIGYVDGTGGEDADVLLGYARARAAGDWLAAHDVVASRVLIRVAADPGPRADLSGRPISEHRARLRVAERADCRSSTSR